MSVSFSALLHPPTSDAKVRIEPVLPQVERRRARAAEAATLAAGAVKYEVEVNGLQIYVCACAAPGRFLLAAARAQLGGRTLPATRQAVLTFDMQQARA